MSDRVCAYHEAHPAIAICSGCASDICVRCHRVTMTGYALCTTCEGKLRAAFQTDWESARGPVNLLRGFGATSVKVLTAPSQFYASLAPLSGWGKAALFGALTYGVGMVSQLCWSWLFVPDFVALVTERSSSIDLSPSATLALMLMAVPFAAPVMFDFHVLLLGLSLQLFGAQVRWRTIVRIAGYAGAAHLLQVIPPIGEIPLGYMIAIVWLVNLELIAVRRHYESIGMWRTMGAVFLPFFVTMLLPL